MSETTTTEVVVPAIYGQLAAVMSDCDHVAKRDVNQHQRFHFRGIDAVVNAVGPVLRRHKVIVVPNLRSATYETVETTKGKASTACRVVVEYVFVSGVDGSQLAASVAAEAWDTGDKATPKAMSVAFRTALLQALALPTDEPDPDASSYERVAAGEAGQDAPQGGGITRVARGGRMTAEQNRKLHAVIGDLGADPHEAMSWALGRAVSSANELSKADASQAIDALAGELERRRAGAQDGGEATA